jgi:hypothetical protein
MISNLKSQLNGNKVADLLDVVKVGNKLALKLKVFSALNNPN